MNKENISKKSIVVAVSIIIVLSLVVVFSPLGSSLNYVTRPLQQGVYEAGQFIRERAIFAGNVMDLVRKNSELEEKVIDLERQLIEFERLKEENESLRSQLDFTARRELSYVGADVISYQTDGARQLLRIEAGSNQGVENEMAVISRGHVVGVVDSTSSTESVVRLLTDSSFRMSAIVSENDAPGIVKGRLAGSVVMDKIPQFQIPKIGSTVLTSGLGEKAPKNLRIGTISAVSESPDSVFAQAQLEIPFDPRTIETVLVIRQ